MPTEHYSNHHVLQAQKPLGAYLVEAGLLSEAQVGVALVDQHATSLRFGEIVVTRGWVKEQTIEYLMQKVIIPERLADAKSSKELEMGLIRQQPQTIALPPATRTAFRTKTTPSNPNNSKATTPPTEDGVNWIG